MMTTRYAADLHIHSSFSDGTDSAPELVEKLRRAGITCFSLTDHDTIDGLAETGRLVPEGMTFIPGIELSCAAGSLRCHILGYGFDPADPAFLETVREAAALRYRKLELRLQYLEERFGIVLPEEDAARLRGQANPGRPHLAERLVLRGYAADRDDAFARYLKGMPSLRLDAGKGIRAILAAGGIPVWAHPCGEKEEDFLTEEEMLSGLEVLEGLGIRGMECWYAQYGAERIAGLLGTAEEHGLLVSGGSDHHGARKSAAPGTLWSGPLPEGTAPRLTVLEALGPGEEAE